MLTQVPSTLAEVINLDKRARLLNSAGLSTLNSRSSAGVVLYWMNRDQRVNDNWALVYAQVYRNVLP